MDRQQLEYFRTVAHLEQMTRAAEQLAITQPALSASIKRLEAELGVLLFDRHGRNISLNEYGEAFLQYAENILAQFDAASAELQSMKQAQERAVQLLSPPLERFPGLLDRILEHGFNLTLNAIHDSEETIIAKFAAKKTDLCITSMQISSGLLGSDTLTSERMAALVSNRHPLAGQEHVSIYALRGCSYATFREMTGPRRHLEQVCAAAGFAPQIRFKGDRLEDILTSIHVNNHITLLTEESYRLFMTQKSEAVRNRYRVLLLDEPWCTIRRHIYWRASETRTPVLELRDIIVDYFHSENFRSDLLE